MISVGIGCSPDSSISTCTAAADTWLPFHDDWRTRNVATQDADPDSMLSLYRRLLALRRGVPDVAERDVYLCASPRLSEAVRAGLREAGLPRRRLHEECFTF